MASDFTLCLPEMRRTCSVLIVCTLLSVQAWGQEIDNTGGESFRQFGQVEITGSSIINPRAREALPVRVLDRKEIERSGAQDMAQLLQALPMMHSYNDIGTYNHTGFGGYQSAAIHGYEVGTLILVNGRRVAPVGRQRADLDRTTSDVSLLPLSAVERIEILTDGASSLYGSDAIAGVVNIITRQDSVGLHLIAEKNATTGTGGDGGRVGLQWGTGRKDQDDTHLQVDLEVVRRSVIAAGNRANGHVGVHTVGLDAQGQPLYFKPSSSAYGFPGIRQSQLGNTNQCPQGYDPVVLPSGNPQCRYLNFDSLTLYPQSDDRRLHAQFERRLSAEQTVYGEWSCHDQTMTYRRFAQQTGTAPLPDGDNVLFDIDPLHPGWREQHNTHQRAVLGLKGLIEKWHYNLSLTRSRQHFDLTDTEGFQSTNWSNLLNAYGQELLQSPAGYSSTLNNLIASRYNSTDVKQRAGATGIQELLLNASSTIAENTWGDIQLGLVAFSQRQTYAAQGIRNPTSEPTYDVARSNHGVALELQWPAWERLELVAAGRLDSYSDFGQVLTGKLGAKFGLTDKRYVRASLGTGFRAPTLPQMAPYSTLIATGSMVTNTSSNLSYDVYASGNPHLKPEKSRQWSIGLHDQTHPSLAWGADLWNLDTRDSFESWSQIEIATDASLKAQYFSMVNGRGRYDLITLNNGSSNRSGIDYYLNHRWPMATGRLSTQLYGTHNISSKRSLYPGGTMESELGKYQTAYHAVTPRNKWTLSTAWEMSNTAVQLALNYMSGNTEVFPFYSVVDSSGNYVGDQYTHTVSSTWTLDAGGWFKLAENVRLSWAIKNLTDQAAPIRYMRIGAVGTSYYPTSDTRYNNYMGRSLRLWLDWKVW
ncbi:MAG: TonB-dependent receptor [Limnohabitans sp.]|nr:MAG: TonB-dependent receptor [Limnohabitans sp.]